MQINHPGYIPPPNQKSTHPPRTLPQSPKPSVAASAHDTPTEPANSITPDTYITISTDPTRLSLQQLIKQQISVTQNQSIYSS